MFSLIGQTSGPHGTVHIKFIQMGNLGFQQRKEMICVHYKDIFIPLVPTGFRYLLVIVSNTDQKITKVYLNHTRLFKNPKIAGEENLICSIQNSSGLAKHF